MDKLSESQSSSTSSNERLPVCLEWTVKEVADWIENLGYKQYRVYKSLSVTLLLLFAMDCNA